MQMAKLCSPALLYLAISIIALIGAFMQKVHPFAMIVKVIFICLWTWFLNYLCRKGHSGISWFLVLLPFILIVGMMAIVFELISKSNPTPSHKHHNHVVFEGATA